MQPGGTGRGGAGISEHSCWPKDAPALDDIHSKSFIYHFAAEVLSALIESQVHELPD
jgi:hypothetical protein